MPDFSFDRFLDGLAGAMASAQAACRRQCEQRARRWLGHGEEFFDRRDLGPSRLIVALRCDLRLLAPTHAGGTPRVAICVGRAKKAPHCLRVELCGTDLLHGEVRLDDVLLRGFTAGGPDGRPR